MGADVAGVTANRVVTKQPVPMVYVIVDVPTATAVAVPSTGSIVATDVLELVQVPPVTLLPSVDVPAIHIDVLPVMAVGLETIVTVVVT
jgi:hypothetical protein